MISAGGTIRSAATFDRTEIKELQRKDLHQGDIIEIKIGRESKYVFEVYKDSFATGKIFLECLEGPYTLVSQEGELLNVVIRNGAPIVFGEKRTLPVKGITLIRLRRNLAKSL